MIGLSVGSWQHLIGGFPGVEEMDVVEINPTLDVRNATAQLGVELATDLADVVRRADFLTIHLPKTAETKGLVSAALLAQAKAALGGLDGFVANAGIWPVEEAAVSTMTDERWLHAAIHSLPDRLSAAGWSGPVLVLIGRTLSDVALPLSDTGIAVGR